MEEVWIRRSKRDSHVGRDLALDTDRDALVPDWDVLQYLQLRGATRLAARLKDQETLRECTGMGRRSTGIASVMHVGFQCLGRGRRGRERKK